MDDEKKEKPSSRREEGTEEQSTISNPVKRRKMKTTKSEQDQLKITLSLHKRQLENTMIEVTGNIKKTVDTSFGVFKGTILTLHMTSFERKLEKKYGKNTRIFHIKHFVTTDNDEDDHKEEEGEKEKNNVKVDDDGDPEKAKQLHNDSYIMLTILSVLSQNYDLALIELPSLMYHRIIWRAKFHVIRFFSLPELPNWLMYSPCKHHHQKEPWEEEKCEEQVNFFAQEEENIHPPQYFEINQVPKLKQSALTFSVEQLHKVPQRQLTDCIRKVFDIFSLGNQPMRLNFHVGHLVMDEWGYVGKIVKIMEDAMEISWGNTWDSEIFQDSSFGRSTRKVIPCEFSQVNKFGNGGYVRIVQLDAINVKLWRTGRGW